MCFLCYSVSSLCYLFPILFIPYKCSLCYSVPFLSCLFPIHLTLYYCPLCYSVSFLTSFFFYPFHPLQLSSLLLCLLFIPSLTPPPNHRYCFLCYSVSSYPVPFSLFCRTFSSLLFLVISRLRKHIFVKCWPYFFGLFYSYCLLQNHLFMSLSVHIFTLLSKYIKILLVL